MIRSSFIVVLVFGWSLAFVRGVAGSAGDAVPEASVAAEPQTLYLHTEYLPYKTMVDQGLPYRLSRELIRQAILVSARDELGLSTCDQTLRESIPKKAQVVHLMPIERGDLKGKWNVKLRPSEEEEVIWEKTYDYIADGSRMYADMIPKLEVDARGEFVSGLRAAGLQGNKPALRDAQPPGEEIEKLLGQVDFVAQYGAVRAAHQAIAMHGETPEWLGVLARGYANLTLLTMHHWDSTTEVFTARSWLYAQRMTVASQDSDLALWHRAYAWMLGGALQHALADLEVLRQRHPQADNAEPEEADSADSRPLWTKLITPYCMCDRVAVRQVGEEHPGLKPWVTRLSFQLASSYRQERWMYADAQEVAQTCPAAYGVYADLVDYGRFLALSRSGAAWAPLMFARLVPQSLSEIPDVPGSI